MYWHIDADIICMIFMLALCVQLYRNQHVDSQQDRCFAFCVYASVWMMAVDIAASVAMERTVPHWFYVGIMTLYFAILLLGIAGWGRYAVTLIYEQQPKKARTARTVVMGLYWLYVATTLINLRTGWLFTITEDNVYARGALFSLGYWIYVVYVVGFTLFVCMKWKLICEHYLRILLLLLPLLQGLGIYVQLIMPGWLTIIPFYCTAVMISYLFIQTKRASQLLDAKKEELRRAELAARTDTMTGLLNHKTMIAYITEYLKYGGRSASHVLFMIDLDNFKTVNDTMGHRVGDEVLIRTAEKIRRCFRDTDLVARVGGDEFMVLMKNVDLTKAPALKAQELLEAMQFTCAVGEDFVEITGSIGMSYYWGNRKSVESLYAEADSALYQAKKAGKNRFANADGVVDASDGEGMGTVHLRTLLEHMEGGALLLQVGSDVQIQYVNPSFYRTLLVDPEKHPPQPESVMAQLWPADLPLVRQTIRAAAQTGQRQECVCRVGERGERRHLIRMVRHNACDGQGVGRVICTVVDVTSILPPRTEE